MTNTDRLNVLLGTADNDLAKRLEAELSRGRNAPRVVVADTLEGARQKLRLIAPAVIFVDGSFSAGCGELLAREMARHAPVVAAVAAAEQGELAGLIAIGEVDCVAACGNFFEVILALLNRRLRWARHAMQYEQALATDEPVHFGVLLRHEMNNPLTGILGNAEMLLRHPEGLPRDAVPRVETIADLAVRLRETIRRISNAWEARQGQHTIH